jgi:UDP-3-O-[3-hydroxymyristoyl] glucosamine N-acyltransferase
MKKITSKVIASFLGKTLHGDSQIINKPADLWECGPGDLVWCRSHSPEKIEIINSCRPSLVLCDIQAGGCLKVPHICTINPRLDFIKTVTNFYSHKSDTGIHPTAIIHQSAKFGNKFTIGPYSIIGPEVTIGNDCNIGSGVTIQGEVIIGNNCTIKPNSVLGAPGFGFERDEFGRPIHFPHLGKIILDENVWIGSCTTIERATLGITKLGKDVKIDDLVQIGHNVEVMDNTLIMAGAIICGGAQIGKNCWIAPKSVIKEKIKVGNFVTTGLGAVVIRDIDDGLTVVGVPAKPINKEKK